MANLSHKPDIRQANICPPLPKNANIFDSVIYWLGVGLGSGLPQKAPGTWGTLGGLLVAIPFSLLGFFPFLVLTLVSLLLGCYICDKTSKLMNVHDDPHIVFDEWVGIWLAMLPILFFLQNSAENILSLPDFWFHAILAFVVFRWFDIAKPFPIRWADSKVDGGFGIMLDDILAGLMASLVIWAKLLIFPISVN